jgi:hypothetical protein
MADILVNIFIMLATVVVLVGGGYLFLIVLGWWLKLKSGHREQEGLTELLTEAHRRQRAQDKPAEVPSDSED